MSDITFTLGRIGGRAHSRIPEIVFLVAEGRTAKEIGCHLHMSENAVNKALGKFRADVAGIRKGAC